jgi:hypothetical protein
MKGTILTIRSNSQRILTKDYSKYPDVKVFHDIVGGWLELVPFFDTIVWDAELHQCLAFCDEEGKLKNKPINMQATWLWKLALERSGRWTGIKPVGNFLQIDAMPDHLVGDVAVVWGDREFMEEM